MKEFTYYKIRKSGKKELAVKRLCLVCGEEFLAERYKKIL